MDSPVEAEINNFACRYPTLKHDHDLLCTCVNGDMEELACLSTCTEEEHDSECPKTNFAAAWIALKAERDELLSRRPCEFCEGRRYWVSKEGAEIVCQFCTFDYWTPTSGTINALPEPLRRYIHDLETLCDPAGDIQTIVCLRENVRALQATHDEVVRKIQAELVYCQKELTVVKQQPEDIFKLAERRFWLGCISRVEFALAILGMKEEPK